MIGLGMGEGYRGEALARAGIGAGMTVLDVGCGTGVLGAHAQRLTGPTGHVIGLDPSHGMLQIARYSHNLETVQACAERIPLPDASVDALVMGYALRHLPHPRLAFREFSRVLKPGGRLLFLELNMPTNPLVRWAFRHYLCLITPRLIARKGDQRNTVQRLMDYTWASVVQAIPPQQAIDDISAAGFTEPAFHVFAQVLGEYTALRL